uniref:Lipid storage droplets surface-binding protein 2 n=1 Tax=Glossina austeni TaxID=7395 RepID=A0A1A9VHX0_GLOAU
MASAGSKNSMANVNAVSELQIKDAQNLLPHLESLERIIKLPVVGAAWDKSQDVYGKLKGRNLVFNWAFSAVENCVVRAVTTAAPIVSCLDRPIQYVEVKAPIIKDTPQEIYNQAKNKVIDVVQPHIDRVVKLKNAGQQKAASSKDLAWQKANEVLATQYGSLAVNGVDTTSALAERLLEYYFPIPPTRTQFYIPSRLSAVSPTRYHVASIEMYRDKSEKSKKATSLIAALKLHQYINFINASKGTNVEQSTLNDSSSSSSNNCKTPTPQK